ncbi:translational activator for mitochondrial COX1 [Savitreella phatthalungensis]
MIGRSVCHRCLRTSAVSSTASRTLPEGRRTLFGFGKSKRRTGAFGNEGNAPQILLSQDDLFHPLSSSPIPALRKRAEVIKKIGKSPTGKSINFDCPLAGWPTHHDQAEYDADTEKDQYIPLLRQTNEDEHDLRSGRLLTEFNFPQEQDVEEAINMSSWDRLLYTRGFDAVNSERSIRHVSKLMTYPLTVAGVLHQGSPYRSRLTGEGLRSISALRTTLHPPMSAGATTQELASDGRPFRIFVLGARAEAALPPEVWLQGLNMIFPDVAFHVHLIGPEAFVPTSLIPKHKRDVHGGLTWAYHPRLTFTTHTALYHELHASGTFGHFDPFMDVFFLPCPGLGHPKTQGQWSPTIPQLLSTKCGVFATGYSDEDMRRDIAFVAETCKDEHDMLLRPGPNAFASRKYDISDLDPRDIVQNNWGIFGFRGKLYELATEGDYASEQLSV